MAKKIDKLSGFNKGVFKKSKSFIETGKVKDNIMVLPELKNLIPPLKDEEYQQLEANILKVGCREALLVWEREEEGDFILIDGHNRFGICQRNNVDFKIHLVHFDSMQLAREFMIDNQLGRRNLTPEQSSYLRGLRYNSEKQSKGGYDKVLSKAQSGSLTSERLAEEYNVSKNTIKRDAQFASGLENIGEYNQELKKDILSGNAKISKSVVQQLANIEFEETPQTVEDLKQKVTQKKSQKEETNNTKTGTGVIVSKNKLVTLLNQLEKEQGEDLVKELKAEFEKLISLVEK